MRKSSPRYQDGAYFVMEGCCSGMGLQGNQETNLGPINIRGMQWGLRPRPEIPYGAAAQALAPGMLKSGFRITRTGNSLGWVIDNQQAWSNQRDLYESLLTQLEQDRMGGVLSWPDYVIKKNLYETWLSRLNGIGSAFGLGDLGAAKKKKKPKIKKLTAAQAKKLKAAKAKAAATASATAVPPDVPGATPLPVVEYTGTVPLESDSKMTMATAAAVGIGSFLLLFRRH